MSCMYGDIKNVILVLLPLMRVSMSPVILSGAEGSVFHVMPGVGEASDGLESQSLRVASLPQDVRSGFT